MPDDVEVPLPGTKEMVDGDHGLDDDDDNIIDTTLDPLTAYALANLIDAAKAHGLYPFGHTKQALKADQTANDDQSFAQRLSGLVTRAAGGQAGDERTRRRDGRGTGQRDVSDRACQWPSCREPAKAPHENPVACRPHWWRLGPTARRWLVKQYSTSELRPVGSYERALCLLRHDDRGLAKLLDKKREAG